MPFIICIYSKYVTEVIALFREAKIEIIYMFLPRNHGQLFFVTVIKI